jgi:hypothetical protein
MGVADAAKAWRWFPLLKIPRIDLTGRIRKTQTGNTIAGDTDARA